MRVRSMPRTASSVSSPSSEPGRFWVVAASVVRSSPVGAGGGPGGASSTNRVTAPGVVGDVVRRAPRARAARAASGAATAASISPRATWAAASAVDVPAAPRRAGGARRSSRGSGRCRGCARPPSDVGEAWCPAATISVEPDGEHRLPDDHQRRVVDQPVEHRRHGALDGVLDRHAARVDRARPDARRAPPGCPRTAPARRSAASGSVRSACSVKVACGPRNASRGTVPPYCPSARGHGSARCRSGQQAQPGSWAAGTGSRSTPQRDTSPRTARTAPLGQPARPRAATLSARRCSPAPSRDVARRASGARDRDQQVEHAVPAPSSAVHDHPQPQRDEPAPGLDDDPHEPLDVARRSARRTPAARRSAASARSRARRPGAPRPATPRCRRRPRCRRAARLDHRDDVLRHELRHPLQPDRVDVGRRRRLDRAGGEQAGPGEDRRQRLRHGAEAGVDDQRDVDRPRRRRPGQLRDQRRTAGTPGRPAARAGRRSGRRGRRGTGRRPRPPPGAAAAGRSRLVSSTSWANSGRDRPTGSAPLAPSSRSRR